MTKPWRAFGWLFIALSCWLAQTNVFCPSVQASLAVQSPPTITLSAGLTVLKGVSAQLQIATVSDAVTPANRLRIEVVTPQTLSVNLLPTTDGKVSAHVYAGCTPNNETLKFTLRVTNEANVSATAEISVQAIVVPAPTIRNAPAKLTLRDGLPYILAVQPTSAPMATGADFLVQYDLPSSFAYQPTFNVSLDGSSLHSGILQNGTIYLLLRANPVSRSLRIIFTTPCSASGFGQGYEIPVTVIGASTACPYPNLTFEPYQAYDTILPFGAVATGDFNGDGRSDIAVVHQTTNQLRTYLGQANGSLQLNGTLPIRRAAVSLIAADFTQDGKLDLALSNYDPTNQPAANERGISILTGTGNGTFTLNRSYDIGHGYLAIGDFNKDSAPDLVVSEWLNQGAERRLRILLNNGQGQFTEAAQPTYLQNNGAGLRIAVAHLNNDDNLDILTSGVQSGRSIYQFNGNGSGNFQGVTAALPGQENMGNYVHSADFNGDGRLDAAVSYGDGTIMESNSLWLFSGESVYYKIRGNVSQTLAAGDFNLDGKRDLLLPNGGILVTGTPSPYCAYPYWFGPGRFGTYVNSLGIGDFNADGRPDFVVPSSFGGLFLYLNQTNITGSLTVVSGATYDQQRHAPGQIAAAFGTELALETATAATNPLPTTLVGTQVRVRDSLGIIRLAPLLFVSPTQVNFVIPPLMTPPGGSVEITNSKGETSAIFTNLQDLAPGLFTASATGQGVAAGQVLRILPTGTQRYEPLARFDTATKQYVAVPIDLSNADEQVFLVLYGTGIQGNHDLGFVRTTVGGVDSATLYAGPQGSYIGLDQVNIRLSPRFLAGRGEVDVIVNVAGLQTNPVRVQIK